MEIQPFILSQTFYITLEELVSAVNVFAATQSYTVLKRWNKKYKKEVLQKAVLICDRIKVHVNKGRFARDTTFRKYDCPFDAVAQIEDNV